MSTQPPQPPPLSPSADQVAPQDRSRATGWVVAGLVGAVMGIVVGFGLFAGRSSAGPGAAAGPTNKWEYRMVYIGQRLGGVQGKAVEDEFAKLGADGWEHTGGEVGGHAVFKRQK